MRKWNWPFWPAMGFALFVFSMFIELRVPRGPGATILEAVGRPWRRGGWHRLVLECML